MKANEFLAEFHDEHFPSILGPWIHRDDHDPPFTMTQLRQMEKQGVIELSGDRYRLTLKAAAIREKQTRAARNAAQL